MRRILIISVLIFPLLFISAYAQKSQTRLDYIEKYKDIAVDNMKTHGIPASITLAQGCLESGDGKSDLAINANNHFGIKCHKDWTGPTYYKMDDDPAESCFRKYKKVEDSFKDHSDFIRYRDRYAFLFDLIVTDYKGWAYGLKKAGYATNPKYPELLIKIIEDYELYKYDLLSDIAEVIEALPPSPHQLEAVKMVEPEKKSYWYKYSQNRPLYVKNGVTYIVANQGDTYAAISKEYNLFKKELLRFNDLKRDTGIAAGTIVYLERKKGKAQKHLNAHVVEEGEDLYGISQRYAVRLKSLLRYNGMKSAKDIAEGDVIYLRKHKK
jgi:LysM repeat protein